MQVNESHPRASLKVSEGGIIPFRRARAPRPHPSFSCSTEEPAGSGGLQSTSRAFTAPFWEFPFFVRPRGSQKKDKKGRLGSWSRCGCMPRGPYGQGDKFIIVFGRRQPSTIHPIAFHRLVCIRIEERAFYIDRDPPSRPPGFIVPT
jgi:hypothetical protein